MTKLYKLTSLLLLIMLMCWTNVTLTYNFQFQNQFVMSCNITCWDQMLTWLINVEKYEFINNITTLYHEKDDNLAFIIVKLDTFLSKQKKLPVLDITGFFFRVVQVIYILIFAIYIYTIYTHTNLISDTLTKTGIDTFWWHAFFL
jgi:mRNA-degrading endonuclease HigB of HigAB toxin-antitoxin module